MRLYIPREDRRYCWIVLAVSYLVMVLYGLSLQALPPLLPAVGADIHLSHTAEGVLLAAFGLPGFILPVVGAWLASRFDRKALVVVALAAMAGGFFLFAVASSYALLVAARLLAGMGGVVLLTFAPVFINESFPRRSIAKVIGVFNTGVPLGLVLGMCLCTFSGAHIGWRWSMGGIGLVCLACTAVFAFFFRGTNAVCALQKEERERQRGATPLVKGVILMALVNLLVNAGTGPFSAFAPQFFSSTGVGAGRATTLISIMMVETALLGPFVGILVDRLRRYRSFLTAASLMVAAAFVLMLTPGVPAVAGPLLLGAATAIFPVTMFPLLNEVVPPHQVAGGLALLLTGSNIGSNLGLGLFGAVLDLFGGFHVPFLMLSSLVLLIPMLAVNIRHHRLHQPA